MRGVSCLACMVLLWMIGGDAVADSSVTKERRVTPLGAGIYVIRHQDAPDTNPQGNTTVIIGERAVLVIDSAYLPSSAREDIAQIRQWTQVPVRYLLNTHWHPDHVRGNAAYMDAFPGLSIIAHAETMELMKVYETGNLDRYPKRIAAMRTALEQGKDLEGKPLDEAAR